MAETRPADPELAEHPAMTALKNIKPDDLSPKSALDLLYQLKKLI